MMSNKAARLGNSNPKNYQIWYHCRALLESFGLTSVRAKQELDYVATFLEEDAKNYHAWSHRQRALRTVDDDDSWNKEMEYGKTVTHVFAVLFKIFLLQDSHDHIKQSLRMPVVILMSATI
jgi:hypothetical protein